MDGGGGASLSVVIIIVVVVISLWGVEIISSSPETAASVSAIGHESLMSWVGSFASTVVAAAVDIVVVAAGTTSRRFASSTLWGGVAGLPSWW